MSSKSTTPNSTSTYEYSHEPFESFQLKVSLLARSLVNCSQVEVRHIKGGSYNRTVVAELDSQGNKTTGIFRIPRFSNVRTEYGVTHDSAVDHRILDHAAVLQFLSKHEVHAPHLLAFDITTSNGVESPYTFQTFSTGIPLASRYGTMKASEKQSIVDALVAFLAHMETITDQYAGRLGVAPESAGISKQSLLSITDQTPILIHNHGFEVGSRVFKENRSLYELLSSLITAQAEEEGSDPPNPISRMWSDLLHILEDMNEYGLFQENGTWNQRNILYHWDLQPRNILIRPNQSSLTDNKSPGWTFDTVIDWDDVYCVPPLLTRCPPVWLWDWSDDTQNPSLPEGFDGDADLMPVDRYTPDIGTLPKGENEMIQYSQSSLAQHRISQEDHDIKQYFEQKFVDELARIYPEMGQVDYHDQAYCRGRWVRRMARFAFTWS